MVYLYFPLLFTTLCHSIFAYLLEQYLTNEQMYEACVIVFPWSPEIQDQNCHMHKEMNNAYGNLVFSYFKPNGVSSG